MSRFPPIDLISLVTGILLGGLLSFVFLRIKKLLPNLKKIRENRQQSHRKTSFLTTDLNYRRSLLRECQGSHLAGFLFPLDDIYVELNLLSRPYLDNPNVNLEEEPLVFQFLQPYIDTPELVRDFPTPTLNLSHALAGGRNIAIMGDIGSGKTTFLNHSISTLLENSAVTGNKIEFFPTLIHINDLSFRESDSTGILEQIAEHYSSLALDLDGIVLLSIFQENLREGNLIILIDGLDELSAHDFDKAVKYVGFFCTEHPEARIVVTTGGHYVSSLARFNFSMLHIQVPGSYQNLVLWQHWCKALGSLGSVSGNTRNLIDADQINLGRFWKDQGSHFESIYHVTQRIWTHLFQEDMCSIDTYLNRVSRNDLQTSDFIKIAEKFIAEADHRFSIAESERLIDRALRVNNKGKNSKLNETREIESSEIIEKTIKSDQLIQLLIENNCLKIHEKNKISFNIPAVLGELLGLSQNFQHSSDWKTLAKYPVDQFVSSCRKEDLSITNWKIMDDKPLYRPFLYLLTLSSIMTIPGTFQQAIISNLMAVIQNPSLPQSIKIKCLSLYSISNHKVTSELSQKMMKQPISEYTQIAALEMVFSERKQSPDKIFELLQHESSFVNYSACLWLFHNWDDCNLVDLASVFENSRDHIRRFLAELFAFKSPAGHELLLKYAKHDNMLCRRATIYGLKLIQAEWSHELLKEMCTEDEQWFVRDSAGLVIEHPWTMDLYIPKKLPDPANSSWLIKHASQMGMGLPAGEFPVDLLLKLVETGTIEEKVAALSYLRENPSQKVVGKLLEITSNNNPLREWANQLLADVAATI